MFFCRGGVLQSDGLVHYLYNETDRIALSNNLSKPTNITEASSICSGFTSSTAIDAQIVYSDGISTAIGEFDWQNVYDAFGMSLLMFAVGAGAGLILNLVRKLR